MKRLITITLLILTAGLLVTDRVSAQVQLSLTLPNLGSPYLSDYISYRSNRILVITNVSGQQQSIYLHGKVEQIGSPGYYIRTRTNYRPAAPIVLEPNETKTLFARDEDWAFVEERHLEDNIPAAEKRQIVTTGILPEGEFQVCVQAFDYFTNRPVSPPEPAGCLFFVATLGSPPQIVQPSAGDVLDQEYPMVSWTPAIILQSREQILYDLYVVELTSGALNPAEVVEQSILYRGGNPFVVENLRQTFYQFLPGDPRLKGGSRYAIVVVAKDSQGSAHFENEGRSEIIIVGVAGSGDDEEKDESIVIVPPRERIVVSPFVNSQLQGRLLYRFHEDQYSGIIISDHISGTFNPNTLMQISGGTSLQNQGFRMKSGNPGGTNPGGSNTSDVFATQTTKFSDLSSVADITKDLMWVQPPPPQYMLPKGYNLQGGKPLKQAAIRFTARLAVGKQPIIQHPDDLEFIQDIGFGAHITGDGLSEPINLNWVTKVVAATTTDDDGYYNVSFFADESFGVLATGPVTVGQTVGDLGTSTFGYGLYRVITMEVEEKWYCHPDVVIFMQPGQSLEVPTQVVKVQSYNLKVEVRSAETGYEQYAEFDPVAGGTPITQATVKLARHKWLHDTAPASFPKNEVKVEEFAGNEITFGPYTSYMLADSQNTGMSGYVIFRRLVKHTGIGGCEGLFGGVMPGWPSDGYYLEAETHPLMSDYNYKKERNFNLAPCDARLAGAVYGTHANEHAPRSADYQPPEVVYVHNLYPNYPKLYVRSGGIFDGSLEPLPNTNLMLVAFNKHKQFTGSETYETDADGFFTKQFSGVFDTPHMMQIDGEDGVTSEYVLAFWKSGYKNKPCSNCGTLGLFGGTTETQDLRMGQTWNVDVLLEPGAFVRGKVVDEHGQPIYGRVKIGDGPWVDFSPEWPVQDEPVFQQTPVWMQQLGLQHQQDQMYRFTDVSRQASQEFTNINVISQGGFPVEYQGGPIVSTKVQKVSVFETTAEYGKQVRVIIDPHATNYFIDTVFVDIPPPHQYEGPVYDLGTFVIKETLHRPKITVVQKGGLMILFDDQGNPVDTYVPEIPVEGAKVLLSNLHPKTTNKEGVVSFVFGSPANEFRLRVEAEGHAPYDQYITIPATKDAFHVTVALMPGKTVTGYVTRAEGGQPIEGARIYAEVDFNNYGAVLIETQSDGNGYYALPGVPIHNLDGLPTSMIIKAAKTDDPSVTYIGKSVVLPAGQYTLNFQLEEAPFLLAHIWNLPVDLEDVTSSGDEWKITGAFVDLPANDRFRPEVETQRLPFKDITVKPVELQDHNGKPIVEPVASNISTTTTKFRSILNDAHITEMSGAIVTNPVKQDFVYDFNLSPVWLTKVRVVKESDGNGHVKTRTFSELEYFRFTYKYDGQFYLGETPESKVISAYKGGVDSSMPESYYLLPENPWLAPITGATPADFYVHDFPAVIDPYQSYVRADTFAISTKLIAKLPKMDPPELIVSAGHIYVTPQKITILEGEDSSLEFYLETWRVRTGPWSFDKDKGGIVTSGVIRTDLVELPAPEILLKPNDMIVPMAHLINLKQVSLGGVIDMDIAPTTELKFGWGYKNKKDPDEEKPKRWRLVLSNSQGGQPAGVIKGLPGWSVGTEVGIDFIENFSGPEGPEEYRYYLTVSANQVVNHYNVIKQTVSHFSLDADGVAMVGNTDLEIPNMSKGSPALFIYTKEQSEIKMRVQSLNTNVETKGKVEFLGDGHPDRIYLNWGHFEVTGNLRIYDDNDNEIKRRTHTQNERLRAKLTKRPNNSNSCGSQSIDVCIDIIDVDPVNHHLHGNQKQVISLGAGNDGWKTVLQGSQPVVGNTWDLLKYQARFDGFGSAFEADDKGTPSNIMWFKVAGDIETDMSKGDEIRLNNIETPFGGLSLTYVFSTQSLVGTLNLYDFPMGAVHIHEGGLQMLMGAKGFFLAASVFAKYPTIDDLWTNFIVGYYPHNLPDDTQNLLIKGMRIKQLPSHLATYGIQGLYFSANKSYGFTNSEENHENPDYDPEDEDDDSGGFYIVKFRVEAGVDARIGLNFGSAFSGAYFEGLAYGEIMVSVNLVVCDVCLGALAELAFSSTMTWDPVSVTISACGTLGLSLKICAITLNPTARVTISGSTKDGVSTQLSFGGTCAGYLGGDSGSKEKPSGVCEI
jgi:hypothetical protein